MHNIKNKSEIFYLYDVHRQITLYKFLSLKSLLIFLAIRGKAKSTYLININMGSDTMKLYRNKIYYVDGECHTELDLYDESQRKYLFYDEYGRTIDPRIYQKEIDKLENDIFWGRCNSDIDCVRYVHSFNESLIAKKPFNSVEHRKKKKAEDNIRLPEFRKGPMPNIHKNRVGRHYYRHLRTFNERKQNADPEVAEYVRPCRRHYSMILEPWVNEKVRPWRNRSWKDCTKKRKQWM